MRQFRLRATRRFVRDYHHAPALRRACTLGALADLRRSVESDPKNFLRRYGKVKGMPNAVREMDISDADRLLFHWDAGEIRLLAVGGHDVVSHYQQTGVIAAKLQTRAELPGELDRLIGSGFFTFDVETEWHAFANEADPSWLSYLDRQQGEEAEQIIQRTMGAIDDRRSWSFVVILGGPGTGKTSILLNLFCRLIDLDVIPQVVVEEQVAEFIARAGGQHLSGWRITLDEAAAQSEGQVLLIDDPASIAELKVAKRLAQDGTFRSVVVALDPLQLSTDATDADLERLQSGRGSAIIELSNCYRQKENVGRATKKALDSIARSSPYYRDDRKETFASQRERITRLSNDLVFTNPSGRSKVIPDATVEDIRTEVRRLQRAPMLWRHIPPFLIVQDDEYLSELPAGWREELQELRPQRWIPMSDALSVKGIEFQHVVVLLGESLFLELENGFEGVSRALYNQRRLYRIPFSRAKDSITVFVAPSSRGGIFGELVRPQAPLMRRR